jgi:Fe2+ or Zn2+ uptake regulation protein
MSYDKETSAFMEAVTKSPQLKVLSILAEKPEEELTKTQIAQKAGIGRTTLYRVWEELEKMRALAPSRQVGAVTLYRLNLESSTVQSILSIKKRLNTLKTAVEKIEEIRTLEKAGTDQFGQTVPIGPNILVRLYEMGALSRENAVTRSSLNLPTDEANKLGGLLEARLVEATEDRLFLTPLGQITARGAVQIWKGKERESIDEALSSIKTALRLLGRDMQDVEGKMGKRR